MPKRRVSPSHKPVIDETIVSIGETDFFGLIEALFRDDDAVGLILLLDRLVSDAISSWRQTKGGTVDEITAIRDTRLLPTIHKLGRVCLDAIRFHHLTICREGLERLARIYDLGRFRDLGTRHGESHLTWSVPSKHTFTQLYVIGSYAMFRQRMDMVRVLLRLQAEQDYRKSRVPLLAHPHFDHGPGEGDLRGYFGDALSQVANGPELFGLFFFDKDAVTDSLCQLDFVVAYALWRQQESGYLNFGRYRNSRTNPIIEHLLEPEVASSLFGSFEPQCLADFLREIDARCARAFVSFNGWQPNEWTNPIRRFLQQYPRGQEANVPDD